MNDIISSIPGITNDIITQIKELMVTEKITNIKYHPAQEPYIPDINYQFINKDGIRIFSILIHPDKSIHIWRPCCQ